MTPQEVAKDRRLRATYNSSLQEFNDKMAEQNNCCAICERPFVPMPGRFKKDVYTAAQDHFHGCCPRRLKKFCGLCNRGLLCLICNKWVMGVLEKQNIPVDRLAAYIQKWEPILRQKGCYAKVVPARRRKKK